MSNKYYKGKAVIDENLTILKADEQFNRFIGENATYPLARSVHPHDVERLENAISEIAFDNETYITVRVTDIEGRYRWMLMHLSNRKVTEDKQKTIDVEIQDIATFMDTIEGLSGENDRCMEYFSLMEYLMFSYDVESDRLKIFMRGSHQQINFYNGTLKNWSESKIANEEVDAKSINTFRQLCMDIKSGKEKFEYEFKMMVLEQHRKMDWCMVKGKTITDPKGSKHVIATMSVINPVNNNKIELTALTENIDVGTDILNKRAMTEYVRSLVASKPDFEVTIAVIDIDNFKTINDNYGHMFGDKVIRDVADVLKSVTDGIGVAGRIGGDEMMVVFEDIKMHDEKRSLLRTIRNNVQFLYKDMENMPKITCSIGSASYPGDASTYDELFSIADKMLYLAKEKGRNRYIIYLPDIHEDYIQGKTALKEKAKTEDNFYQYKKTSLINRLINAYRGGNSEKFKKYLYEIFKIFKIDSVYIYKKQPDDKWSRKVMYGEAPDIYDGTYLENNAYIADFTEEGLTVIDNINFFERKHKETYDVLSAQGICQAIQFIVDYEGLGGENSMIVSLNRQNQLSKWSQSEITYMALTANMIGMEYGDD